MKRACGECDEDAAMDVLSRKERENQKRTWQKISKISTSDKEDHRQKADVRGTDMLKVSLITLTNRAYSVNNIGSTLTQQHNRAMCNINQIM